MNELLDVRHLPDYLPLVNECEEIIQGIGKQALWFTILTYFRLGRAFLKRQEQGLIEVRYGEAVVKALAQDLSMHVSVLYRSISCARFFGTEQSLKGYAQEYERTHGKPLSWTEIRDRLLPQPKDDPENHGGVEAVAQHIMSLSEKLAHELEGLKALGNAVSNETKQEIAGVVHKVEGVIAEPTFLPTATIDRDSAYLDYIRSLPCAICGQDAEPHHVEGGGVALKGSDYLTVPLCRKHHDEYHTRGRVSFQQVNRVDIYYETTLCLAGFIKLLNGGSE